MVKFLIVVTGYNWQDFVKPCFDSVKNQTYKNFIVSVVDDGSTDASTHRSIQFMDRGWKGCILRKNTGTIFARREAIKLASDEEYDVICLLDGDDQLLPDALQTVVECYEENPGILMTYGNYEFNDGSICPVPLHYPDHIHETRDYRKDTFRCTHLRTFRRELFEKIPHWHIRSAEINSYPDAEILFSMMEMSGKDRIGVIEKPIYKYNTNNPLNTLKRFGKDHKGYEEIINRPKRDLI